MVKIADLGIFRHIGGVRWDRKILTSKCSGSRSSLTKIATFGPPRAEKLVFSDKTLAWLNDSAPKRRHLWWCLVGAITIVQCILGALFLGLACNIFLVLRLWCYALSATSRRLATAVAHLLYNIQNFWPSPSLGIHRYI